MSNIEKALQDLKEGKLIVVLDDWDRENEGDLIGLPEFMDEESVNFMIKEARGLLCAPISQQVAVKHGIALAPKGMSDGTNFTLSIDSPNSTTGISAGERLETLQDLLSNQKVDFKTPGHLFPLIARPGGLSVRRGHTEAAVDLAKLAGSHEVGAIIEIIGDDGKMSRRDDLLEFAKKYDLTFITIDDLVEWIKVNKSEIWKVDNVSEFTFSKVAKLPTEFGEFNIKVAKHIFTNEEYPILWKGDIAKFDNPLVRIHSRCVTSETFHSLKCDCKNQIDEAMRMIQDDQGLIIYTPDEGRGIGIFNKIEAYHMQDQGLDTIEANKAIGMQDEMRNFDIPGKLLRELNISQVQVLTNNPLKIKGLEVNDIKVSRVPLWTSHDQHANDYIETKINKMNHIK